MWGWIVVNLDEDLVKLNLLIQLCEDILEWWRVRDVNIEVKLNEGRILLNCIFVNEATSEEEESRMKSGGECDLQFSRIPWIQ